MINAKWCGIIGVTNYKELKMADRIVQLTDEDDNNIFPAAGTMPTGAITTNMLQNNSVTSDKIDFTTLEGGNVPVAATSIHMPYGPTSDHVIDLTRIGNIVFAFANLVLSSVPSMDSQTASETVPEGYRPVAGTHATIIFNTVAGGGSTNLGLTLSPNGTIAMSNRETIQLSERLYGQGCWITKDEWPS